MPSSTWNVCDVAGGEDALDDQRARCAVWLRTSTQQPLIPVPVEDDGGLLGRDRRLGGVRVGLGDRPGPWSVPLGGQRPSAGSDRRVELSRPRPSQIRRATVMTPPMASHRSWTSVRRRRRGAPGRRGAARDAERLGPRCAGVRARGRPVRWAASDDGAVLAEARLVLVEHEAAVEVEEVRVRAEEPAHVRRRRHEVELLLLHRPEVLRPDLGLGLAVEDVQSSTQASLAECVSDFEHGRVGRTEVRPARRGTLAQCRATTCNPAYSGSLDHLLGLAAGVRRRMRSRSPVAHQDRAGLRALVAGHDAHALHRVHEAPGAGVAHAEAALQERHRGRALLAPPSRSRARSCRRRRRRAGRPPARAAPSAPGASAACPGRASGR